MTDGAGASTIETEEIHNHCIVGHETPPNMSLFLLGPRQGRVYQKQVKKQRKTCFS